MKIVKIYKYYRYYEINFTPWRNIFSIEYAYFMYNQRNPITGDVCINNNFLIEHLI